MMAQLLNIIITLIQSHQRRWSVEHVKRGANGAAYGLAKHAVNNGTDSTWTEEIPRCIFDIVFSELFALSVRVSRFILK
jgi:hypothetical protein